ncbi:GNAT family N-acetyltransferase [Corynebacterium sp. TAE3-ERU30]|uniref:N-acetylglutamate synthase, CG3035 family n=1 Tax=Corynebacterium sp. TAE3-ERU30 TaxID=2849496 RepID=UPI001C476D82|nr:GNAT family N-acetyltransferase [Corynebacterium sp. TAE3-ERU30]MBV7282619.1 GNAT family N-acetyltransferase [Corynebacterium sp. TAE3-ERU30]
MLSFPFSGRAPTVGDRVIVRRRIPHTPGHLTDVIGHVVSLEPLILRPQSVGGLPSSAPTVLIDASLVKILKVLSPRRVMNSDIRAIEHATALAFPGIEHAWSEDGQWLMRAGDGITERSNSATPLGASAGFSLPPLAEMREFYARHELPVRVHLPERIARNAERLCRPPAWELGPDIIVMSRSLSDYDTDTPPTLPEGMTVSVEEQPDAAWLEQYHFRGQALPVHALELLMREIEGRMGFARIRVGEQTVAITRATITESPDGRRWLGYSAVEVKDAWRRRGLGTQLGQAVLHWGAENGATDAYLQVIASNTAGIGLYERLGFIEHHRHRYATELGARG